LDCSNNQLTALDVSKNTELTNLYCDMNQLTTLDVSKNTKLTWLNCDDNQLTTLDVSKNTELAEALNCEINRLTSLDVSKNTKLKLLNCHTNQLTSLDISKNTELGYLSCHKNPGNGTVFPVTAWFDNNTIPNSPDGKFMNPPDMAWYYNGKYIKVDFRKVE